MRMGIFALFPIKKEIIQSFVIKHNVFVDAFYQVEEIFLFLIFWEM